MCIFECCMFVLMIWRPPISTRTDTLFPYTTLFRSRERKMIAALEMRALGLERSTPFAVDQPARRVREVACRVAMALAPPGLKEQRPPAAEAPERIVCPRAGRDQLSLGRGLAVRPAKRPAPPKTARLVVAPARPA